MSKLITLRDWVGFAVVLASAAAVVAYRHLGIDAREWGALCNAASPPFNCTIRSAVIFGQNWTLWGAVALVLGAWAFFLRGPFAVRVLAVVIGVAGVVNYNATGATLGAALGAWAWLRPEER